MNAMHALINPPEPWSKDALKHEVLKLQRVEMVSIDTWSSLLEGDEIFAACKCSGQSATCTNSSASSYGC